MLDSADRVLLLKNERDEWELPGRRIEFGEIVTHGCFPAAERDPVLFHEHRESASSREVRSTA